jgi:hypothetical protein
VSWPVSEKHILENAFATWILAEFHADRLVREFLVF